MSQKIDIQTGNGKGDAVLLRTQTWAFLYDFRLKGNFLCISVM
jgi:hypothetical protein